MRDCFKEKKIRCEKMFKIMRRYYNRMQNVYEDAGSL